MDTATRESMIDDAFARLRQLAIDPTIPPETARRAAVDLIRLINHPPKSRASTTAIGMSSELAMAHRHQRQDHNGAIAESLPANVPAAVSLHDLMIPDAEEISRILDEVLGPESSPKQGESPALLAAPPPPGLPRRTRFKKRKKVSR